jgi:RNA polymerase sigma factor (sigma-70 family)
MPKFNFNPLDDFTDDGSFNWLELKSGRKEGLEKLYLKYSKELFRYGMLIKPNRSFVQDCIQELFLDLWKYKDNLSPTENVRSYLMKSLSNKMGKEIQKESRFTEEPCPQNYGETFLIDSIEEKLITIEQNEGLILRLRGAIEKLPFRQREIINHLFFEKLTYEQTSRKLGINIDSCYTLAWKAIRKLKECMHF